MLVCALHRGAVGCLRCGCLVVLLFLVVSAVGFGWFWFYLAVGCLCLLTCACFLSLGSLWPVCFGVLVDCVGGTSLVGLVLILGVVGLLLSVCDFRFCGWFGLVCALVWFWVVYAVGGFLGL